MPCSALINTWIKTTIDATQEDTITEDVVICLEHEPKTKSEDLTRILVKDS